MTHSIDSQFFLDPGVPMPRRVSVEHEPTEQAVEVQHNETGSLASTALSVPEFYRYLGRARKLGQLDEATELLVRDVWVAAFKAACRYAIEHTAALSRPDVVNAVTLLAEVVRGREE